MSTFIKKTSSEVLSQALRKITTDTPITAVSPGSVARAIAEAVTVEIGDLYDILDYNLNQNLLSTATGTALDLFGSLFNIQRKSISDLAAIDKSLGAFYFYINSPVLYNIEIPAGTNVYSDTSTYIGRTYSYKTTETVTILSGRTIAYAGLIPNFSDTAFTSGKNTLVVHDFNSPPGVTVLCKNVKPITQLVSYENDEAYRVRIMKGIRVANGGTSEAVRFAGLNVPGVRDITIGTTPYGMASFEAVVVPESNANTAQVVQETTTAMSLVKPVGVRMFVKTPERLPLDVTIDLVIPLGGANQASENAIKRASVGVARYLNSLMPGDQIIYNRLISSVLDASNLIKDVIIKRYAINGLEILRRNYKPNYDQQVVSGNITINLATA